MKKLIQNKKLVIVSGIVIALLIGILVWVCVSCSGDKNNHQFSEDGMEVVDSVEEDKDDETDEDKSDTQAEEDEIKAPSNWGAEDDTSLDVGDNATSQPEEDKAEPKEEKEAETTSGYGKPF